MNYDTLVNKYINKVAYAIGFDISDSKDRDYVENLIRAAISDMVGAGVGEDALSNDPLTLTALIFFVTDSMNSTAGEAKQSTLYLNFVDKLRR